MWFSFWKSRDRFSMNELRHLTEQLENAQTINDVNKDFTVEALRSIAELVTYGDQHDPKFFEYFMEKQVMGVLVRILKNSRNVAVSVQLLQTMSIMIQNLKNEHAIYYLFSNEHINYLITYNFDFRNEELLLYYISFLRAISGKLNKSTIPLLVKTDNDEVVSFPLYTEAVRFAFHEDNMIRVAVRALTLNVFHVGDESVNRYVTNDSHTSYFSNLVGFFRNQCFKLNDLVAQSAMSMDSESESDIFFWVDEIETGLCYFSDVISAGIPNIGKLITENILQMLIFPLVFPSLGLGSSGGAQISAATSFYLLCCILRIVKFKDLVNSIAASLFIPLEAFRHFSESKPNGHVHDRGLCLESRLSDNDSLSSRVDFEEGGMHDSPCSSSSHIYLGYSFSQNNQESFSPSLREVLLMNIRRGDGTQVLGSLFVLAVLLQAKELDESFLDALGILPQRMQHRKLLLQALVGEDVGEEQLFSSINGSNREDVINELDYYLQKIKRQNGMAALSMRSGASPRMHKSQVLDTLVHLFCRSNISAETLWVGGWLLRQLFPHSHTEFCSQHLRFLKDTYMSCVNELLSEVDRSWLDLHITVLCDEWRKCKRAIESPSLTKDPRCILLPSEKFSVVENHPSESSFFAAGRMHEIIKVVVLLLQIQIFTGGRTLPDKPPIPPPMDIREKSRAVGAGLAIFGQADTFESLGPKPGMELKLVEAVPCRIAFERGKEWQFYFLALSIGTYGWAILVEEKRLNQYGVVRLTTPLAGSNPRVDEKHPQWMHLRVRPQKPWFMDPKKCSGQGWLKARGLVDGRWTLAFRDEDSCKAALNIALDELCHITAEAERRLRPLFEPDDSFPSSPPSGSGQPPSAALSLSSAHSL